MARGLLIAYAFTSACASSPWHWRWRATQDHEPDLSHAQQYGKKVNASALLRVTFEDARRAFKRLDTKYLLIYGTALGFHRSGDFIPWDYDVDVGVFFEDLPPHDVLQRGMARFGLTPFSAGRSDPYSWRCDFRSYPILYQYVHETGFRVDLYVLHRNAGEVWDYSPAHRYRGQAVSSMGCALPDAPLSTVTDRLTGRRFLSAPEAWLADIYGDDWRLPREGSGDEWQGCHREAPHPGKRCKSRAAGCECPFPRPGSSSTRRDRRY